MTLFENLDELNRLLNEKDELKEKTKENSAAIDSLKKTIADQMLNDETTKVVRSGHSFTLQEKVKYSKKAGNDERFFETLRENDLGDLIKETVNAQTLQGAIKSIVEENSGELPEDLAEVINVYEYLDIGRRKA